MNRLLILLGVTFIWGLGFVGTRWTFLDYSPIWSNSLRFIFAGIICLPYLIKKRSFKNLKAPFYCSILLLTGLQLQTIGIEATTLAKSGFLTVFYAIFTPILSYLFLGKVFRKTYWLLVSLAMFGIALLCNLEFHQFNYGDFMNLSAALFFSIHILVVDKFAKDVNPIEFNFQQCFFIGILGAILGLTFEGPVSLEPLMDINNLFTKSSLSGFFILSVFSSLIAFTFQVYAQKGVPPHIVSLMFLMESIFASIFGYMLFNESLNTIQMVGCVLVLVAVALIPKLTTYLKKQSHGSLECAKP